MSTKGAKKTNPPGSSAEWGINVRTVGLGRAHSTKQQWQHVEWHVELMLAILESGWACPSTLRIHVRDKQLRHGRIWRQGYSALPWRRVAANGCTLDNKLLRISSYVGALVNSWSLTPAIGLVNPSTGLFYHLGAKTPTQAPPSIVSRVGSRSAQN